MEENLSNFKQAQNISNFSMPIVLFLYATYYEQNIDKDSSSEAETFL